MPGPFQCHCQRDGAPGGTGTEEQENGGGVEQDVGCGEDFLHQAAAPGVPVACRHAVEAHSVPLGEGFPGLCGEAGVAVDANGRVLFVGVVVDEEVVGASGDVVVADEGALFEEEVAAVAEVAARAGVGVAQDGAAEVVGAVGEVVVLLHDTEEGFGALQSAESEHDLGILVLVAFHDAAEPLEVLRGAVGVGEHQDVVLGALDADGEGVFLALEEVDVLLEGDDFQVGVVVLEEFEDELGVVVAEVVDHNNLEIRVVLLEQVDEVFLEPSGVVAGGEHHGDGRELGVGAATLGDDAFAVPNTEAEMEKSVVEAKNGKRGDERQCQHNCVTVSQKKCKVKHMYTSVSVYKNTYNMNSCAHARR